MLDVGTLVLGRIMNYGSSYFLTNLIFLVVNIMYIIATLGENYKIQLCRLG